MNRPPPDGDQATRQTALPADRLPDEVATRSVEGIGIIAELRAVTETGDKKTLPLYALPDTLVLGRGSAAEWQIDDPSLSRTHAQFKWNGSDLTVEDLGSANGTRVGVRPARTALPVKPGDTIQCGTVMITFELRGQARPVTDEQATRQVSAPPPDASASAESSYTPSGLEAPPTVVRVHPPPASAVTEETPALSPVQPAVPPPPAPSNSGAKPHAAVFHPERDAARPDEPTRPWDPRAALVHAPEKTFDAVELTERLKKAWKVNRRPFVMAGAAVWVGLLLLVWQVATRSPAEDDGMLAPPVRTATGPRATGGEVSAPNRSTPTSPTVSALPNVRQPEAHWGPPGSHESERPGVVGAANPTSRPTVEPLEPDLPSTGEPWVGAPVSERDETLAQAVAAYDQGRLSEALIAFRKLAALDPKDPGARFMVELIEARGAQVAP